MSPRRVRRSVRLAIVVDIYVGNLVLLQEAQSHVLRLFRNLPPYRVLRLLSTFRQNKHARVALDVDVSSTYKDYTNMQRRVSDDLHRALGVCRVWLPPVSWSDDLGYSVPNTSEFFREMTYHTPLDCDISHTSWFSHQEYSLRVSTAPRAPPSPPSDNTRWVPARPSTPFPRASASAEYTTSRPPSPDIWEPPSPPEQHRQQLLEWDPRFGCVESA